MAEANSQTADPSVRGAHISDLITMCIFAAASFYTAPGCADRRRGRLRLLPAAVGHRATFAEIPGYYQAAGPPAITIGLTLHIDVLSH
jgi:hypothetical protein